MILTLLLPLFTSSCFIAMDLPLLFSDKKFSPEELMAMILNNSRQIAENFAGT